MEEEYYKRKQCDAEHAQAVVPAPAVSSEKMKICLRRGERVVGYSGKLTYCGAELTFEGDDDEDQVVNGDGNSFPADAVFEYKGLKSKLESLRNQKRRSGRAKLSETDYIETREKTYVSDDDEPVCLTQLSEMEANYPGIEKVGL